MMTAKELIVKARNAEEEANKKEVLGRDSQEKKTSRKTSRKTS